MGALLLIVLVMGLVCWAAYALLMWAFGPRTPKNARPFAQQHQLALSLDNNRYGGECITLGCDFEEHGHATLDALVAAHAAFEERDYAQRVRLDTMSRTACYQPDCPALTGGYCGYCSALQRQIAA